MSRSLRFLVYVVVSVPSALLAFMHRHGECGYVRREELRGDGADGVPIWGGEICFLVAGYRVGEDDAGVAVEEFVNVVVFGDEHGSAPVERGVGLEESRFVEQGFGGVVHACGSPKAFALWAKAFEYRSDNTFFISSIVRIGSKAMLLLLKSHLLSDVHQASQT